MDLLVFFGLAVLTNTAISPPFDPVLLWFAHGADLASRVQLVALGCVAAGLAAAGKTFVIDAWRRARGKGRIPEPTPPSFYRFAAAIAASPLPFMTVRLAALRYRPRVLPFAAAVAIGRLPRYALTVSVASLLSWPAVVVGIVAIGVGVVAGRRLLRGTRPSLAWARPVV